MPFKAQERAFVIAGLWGRTPRDINVANETCYWYVTEDVAPQTRLVFDTLVIFEVQIGHCMLCFSEIQKFSLPAVGMKICFR